MHLRCPLPLRAFGSCAALALALAFSQDPALGPGLLPVDAFHPDNKPGKEGARPPLPKPAYGGQVAVYTEETPKGLNATVDNSGGTRRILYELHETLLLRDWETTEWKPDLALRWDLQDRLVPKPGADVPPPEYLIGAIRDQGESYLVDPKPGHVSTDTPLVAKKDVESIERGTVLTFHLRPRVLWHDGHPFDAHDVAFSWRVFQNPDVECGEKRFRFQKIVKAEVIDFVTVRFTCERQYYNALETLGDMPLLPAHLYDLDDPDNEDGKAKRAGEKGWKASPKEAAEYVNKNPHNRDFVGLGPYKLARWNPDGLEAERFDKYFDPSNAGYFDAIRWRAVPEDAGFQAVLNGELDFFWKMASDDYFGASTQDTSFTDRFYKGYFYTGDYWYVGWNLRRPELSDAKVRRALAMLCDFDAFKRSFYRGLAIQVTGSGSIYGPGYDKGVLPLPFDPPKARALLDEAGWKEGKDGLRAKDGAPLEIEVLVYPNNKTASGFLTKYQEDLARAGIRLKLTTLDGGGIGERRRTGDFDAVALGWQTAIESDPEQIWHSKGGSNFGGFSDASVDALILKGQRELDPARRAAVWHELHRKIYDLQPYLFCYNVPRKFAMNRRIRGFQSVPVTPNYVIRRWYFPEGTPGTRPTLERGH
jgi:ABC-type transport system substrate-binding protein